MNHTITTWITEFIDQYHNTHSTKTEWETPLVAFADAADPYFEQLKTWVSPSHFLPRDLLPSARSVIAFFIPFVRSVAQSNHTDEMSSTAWAYAYVETNRLIADLNRHIYDRLQLQGHTSTQLPATHNFDHERLISDWSHRHIAYIAGLGSMGVHNLLITAKGTCGRLGSIVTDIELKPTPRSQQPNCLYHYDQTCLQCVKKCVAQALQPTSFDRHKCYGQLQLNGQIHSDIGLTDVCGKCITITPCSFTNPVKLKL